jgi:hypothetical protein
MSNNRKTTKELLQDWIPSGKVEVRVFNWENMVAFAEHYAKEKQLKNELSALREENANLTKIIFSSDPAPWQKAATNKISQLQEENKRKDERMMLFEKLIKDAFGGVKLKRIKTYLTLKSHDH